MRSAYSPVAAQVLPWLAIAVFINCLAQVPFAMLQGAVDAKAAAFMYMFELPLYIGMLVCSATAGASPASPLPGWAACPSTPSGSGPSWPARFPAARGVVRRTAILAFPALAILIAAALLGAR